MIASAAALFLALNVQASVSGARDFPIHTSSGPVKQAELGYIKGVMLERAGWRAAALAEYERAYTADPQSAYLAQEAAELSVELGLIDKAAGYSEALLSSRSGGALPHLIRGRVLWAQGDAPGAQAAFERALEAEPGLAEAVFSLARLLSLRSPKKAESLLNNFLSTDPPEAAQARFELAKIELHEERFEEAIGDLEKSIDLDPDADSLPARYALAELYESKPSSASAVLALSIYQDILALEPENTAVIDRVGEIQVFRGQWDQALISFERARKINPRDPIAALRLAEHAEKEGEFSQAADFLYGSAAVSEDPGAVLRLSYDLTQANRLAQAISVLEAAHRQWPQNDRIAYFLALGYDDAKRGAEAVQTLRAILAAHPADRDARYELGVLLEKQNDIAGAEAEFDRLLADHPHDAEILNYLGYSLADRGLKLGKAEGLISRAVSADSKNGAFRDSLGWVHFKLGRSTEALSDLAGALALLPEDETVWEHYGDVSAALGHRGEAWLAFKRSAAFAEKPDSSSARKADRLKNGFSKDELGKLLAFHLSAVQGGVIRISCLADLKVEIGGQVVPFKALIEARAPDRFKIDLLGALFMSVGSIEVEGSRIDASIPDFPGMPRLELEAAARAVASPLRDFLSGRLWRMALPSYRKPWWRRSGSVKFEGISAKLDPSETFVVELDPDAGPVRKIILSEFGREKGRWLARRFSARGPHFSIEIVFSDIKLELSPEALPKP